MKPPIINDLIQDKVQFELALSVGHYDDIGITQAILEYSKELPEAIDLTTLLGNFLRDQIALFEALETMSKQADNEIQVEESVVEQSRTNLQSLMDQVRSAFPSVQIDIGQFIAKWRAEVAARSPESKLRRHHAGEA